MIKTSAASSNDRIKSSSLAGPTSPWQSNTTDLSILISYLSPRPTSHHPGYSVPTTLLFSYVLFPPTWIPSFPLSHISTVTSQSPQVIFKCKFYYYSSEITGAGNDSFEKIIWCSQSPRGWGSSCHTAPHWENTRGSEEAEGVRGKQRQKTFLWFLQEKQDEAR